MLWFLTGSLTLFLPLRLFYNLHPLKFLHEISRPDLPALLRFPRLISTTRFTLFRFSSSANTDLKIDLPENSLELSLYLQPLHLLPGDIGLFFFFNSLLLSLEDLPYNAYYISRFLHSFLFCHGRSHRASLFRKKTISYSYSMHSRNI